MQPLVAIDFAGLPEDVCLRHAAFLAAAQGPDGGFPGRRGPSDLYYTGFALWALAMLGRLTAPIAQAAGGFLRERLGPKGTVPFSSDENRDSPPDENRDSPRDADGNRDSLPGRSISAADAFSLVSGSVAVELATGADPLAEAGRGRRQLVAELFRPFQRADGGYAKTLRGASSTYQTFLVVRAMQWVGLAPQRPEAIVRLIQSRQREDGGFVEIDQMRSSGTSPTAAAVDLLTTLGALDEATRGAAAKFLLGMQTTEGGLRANRRIPGADLLSTFSGLVALGELGAMDRLDAAAVARFVRSLDRPGGGFFAAAWDDTPDVEYTFYGLGTLALYSGFPV